MVQQITRSEKGNNMNMKERLLEKIAKRDITVGVVGLGYVGLPLAVEKAKAGFKTIGFDVQEEKVKMNFPLQFLVVKLLATGNLLTSRRVK